MSHALTRDSVMENIPSSNQLEITFRDLCYSVPLKKGTKPILKNISARFRPGKLTVILGNSGAGKTSLLNLLAGEAKTGHVSGDILINGRPMTGKQIGKISGFVYQEDVILDTQTVREAITMSATLRLPKTVSAQERQERVDEVIQLMHLEKCQNTMVGSAMIKGVSGGEKKRASIAMELVMNPPILFLDEPTSGLDSYSAFTTISHLKTLAESGRTIIATLHQPSSEIFHLIDDLILMTAGEIMYCGPAEDSVEYFAKRGFPCPQFSNPADFFFMSVFNTGKAKDGSARSSTSSATSFSNAVPKDDAGKEKFRQLLDVWPTTDEGKRLRRAVDYVAQHPPAKNTPMPQNTFMAGFMTQLKFLLGRGWRNSLRNPMVVRAKFAQIVIFAAIADIVYWQIPDRDFKGQVQDRAGALFFILLNLLMANAMNNLTVFSAEKLVFQREHHARMYGLPSYFLAKTLIDLPLLILMPVIYILGIYFAVGFQLNVGKFFILLLGGILISNCGAAIGFWAAATFANLSVALAAIPLVIIPLMIFSGLFVNLATLPAWIRWFQWLSPIKYGFVAFMKNEFDGLSIGCKESDGPTCRPLTGDMVIDNYGFTDKGSIAVNIIALAAFWVGLWTLAYVGLWNAVRKAQGNLKNVASQTHKEQMGLGSKSV